MKKENVRIKEDITLLDQINAIESIVSSHFRGGDYTPYFCDYGKIEAIVQNFIEGVEIDVDSGEIIYDCVMKDKELYGLVIKFFTDIDDTEDAAKTNEENAQYISCMNFVMNHAIDKVDFLKQQIIHTDTNLDKIGEFCDVISGAFENFSRLDLESMTKLMTPENIKIITDILNQLKDKDITMDMITDVIKNSVGFNMDKASAEIINSKNAQILDLQKEVGRLKNKESSKNVLNDKK